MLFTVVGLFSPAMEVLYEQHGINIQFYYATCRQGNNGGKLLLCLVLSTSAVGEVKEGRG